MKEIQQDRKMEVNPLNMWCLLIAIKMTIVIDNIIK